VAGQDVAGLVAELDRAKRRLRALLRSKDKRALTKRPPSGEWSVLENVRHLLFAEQLHLGKFLPNGFEWSRVAFSGRTGKAYAQVGTEPTDDLEKIFREWDKIHRPIRKVVTTSRDPDVRRQLAGNLSHLEHHIDTIEKLLSKAGA
jgi:hypothetical protein